MATQGVEREARGEDGYTQFVAAGDSGKGRYRCSECSHGVTVYRTLPVCPRCAGSSWERAEWSPFGRATRPQ